MDKKELTEEQVTARLQGLLLENWIEHVGGKKLTPMSSEEIAEETDVPVEKIDSILESAMTKMAKAEGKGRTPAEMLQMFEKLKEMEED